MEIKERWKEVSLFPLSPLSLAFLFFHSLSALFSPSLSLSLSSASRVGEGPFPTELEDEDCLKLRKIGEWKYVYWKRARRGSYSSPRLPQHSFCQCRISCTECHHTSFLPFLNSGGEFGTTTGRPRRCGWIDIPQLKYAAMINGTYILIR